MIRPRQSLAVQVGVNPILWSNDDFHELGADTPLERCLSEMRAAGYAGTELGRKYPRIVGELSPLLARHGLRLVSGWHSLRLLEQPLQSELARFAVHLNLLSALGAPVAIVAECSGETYSDPRRPLRFAAGSRPLEAGEWQRLAEGLSALAGMASGRGIALAYHHHAGTVIQTAGEIRELLTRAPTVGLLLDSGHLALVGADPVAVLHEHAARVVHVHLKDVRADVLASRRGGSGEPPWSFAQWVRAGVFTVPGDGMVDFPALFSGLAQAGYRGWLVVEADQDPARRPPLEYARMGRDYVRSALGV